MSSERILVVDDDPIYLKSTRAVQESHRYQVDAAQEWLFPAVLAVGGSLLEGGLLYWALSARRMLRQREMAWTNGFMRLGAVQHAEIERKEVGFPWN